jgi:hypothetical protein
VLQRVLRCTIAHDRAAVSKQKPAVPLHELRESGFVPEPRKLNQTSVTHG